MSAKVYKSEANERTAKPRAKRLRELGGIAAGGGSTVVNVNGSGTIPSGDGHTHANKTALDQISTDSQGYEYLTRLVEVEVETTDPETGETTKTKEWQSKTEKVKAGYADVAHDLTPDSPVRQQFLSRIADDVAQGIGIAAAAGRPHLFADGAVGMLQQGAVQTVRRGAVGAGGLLLHAGIEVLGLGLADALVEVAGRREEQVFAVGLVHPLGQHGGVEDDGLEQAEQLIGALPGV